jgi:hypothetical protein
LNDLTTLNSAVCARPEVCNCRFGADRRRHPFVPRYLQPTQQTEATTEVHMTMSRRTFVQAAAVGAAATTVLAHTAIGRDSALATRSIPSSGEQIPAVGLGTWITFNVGDDQVLRDECADVMGAFFEAGT